jgi:hypothetical protein
MMVQEKNYNVNRYVPPVKGINQYCGQLIAGSRELRITLIFHPNFL